MTGLQLLNASLLKVAVLTLCKIYIETGFVGAPCGRVQGGKGASSVKQLTAYATSGTVKTMQHAVPFPCRIVFFNKKGCRGEGWVRRGGEGTHIQIAKNLAAAEFQGFMSRQFVKQRDKLSVSKCAGNVSDPTTFRHDVKCLRCGQFVFTFHVSVSFVFVRLLGL